MFTNLDTEMLVCVASCFYYVFDVFLFFFFFFWKPSQPALCTVTGVFSPKTFMYMASSKAYFREDFSSAETKSVLGPHEVRDQSGLYQLVTYETEAFPMLKDHVT